MRNSDAIFFIIAAYFMLSFFIWMFRVLPMDCEHRYLDYVFPITMLHCKVNP